VPTRVHLRPPRDLDAREAVLAVIRAEVRETALVRALVEDVVALERDVLQE
jgi:hypothetical protein